jgi:acyl-CoA thioesterase FadM
LEDQSNPPKFIRKSAKNSEHPPEYFEDEAQGWVHVPATHFGKTDLSLAEVRSESSSPAIVEPVWNPEPETLETVRFSDCDPFGHLNNARYLDYFINARDQHLSEAYNVDLAAYSVKHQENWLVKEHRIAYLRPVKLKEKIRIVSRLLSFSDSETSVEGLMISNEGRHLKAFLWTRFIYVNLKTGRPAKHPEFITKILKATLIDAPAFKTGNFDQRMKDVLHELRAKALRQRSAH